MLKMGMFSKMNGQEQAQRFLQTDFWADFKTAHGWKKYSFILSPDGTVSERNSENQSAPDRTIISVLVRKFSLKLTAFYIAYVPMAPECANLEFIETVSANLKKYLPKNTVYIRFDPPVGFATATERDEAVEKLRHNRNTKARPASVCVQPPDTTILGLNKSCDELLAAMKSKWRYNIRLSQKKGVEVSYYTADSPEFETVFDQFYSLFEITGKRDGVNFHAKSYYKDLLERGKPSVCADGPQIRLYLAKHEDDYLAGIITLFCKREAVYLYGASGNLKRNLMPAYLLQWTAIQDAKKYGCPEYDFYGIPPTDAENHPMHGLYLFKTGFGGQEIHRIGSIDVPLRSVMYSLYSAAEKIRAWWHKKFLKKLIGR